MKKRITAFILITIMACVSLTGCNFSKKKTLTVGVSIAYPPFEYFDEDGLTPTGIDIDLSKELASRLDMDVAFINTEFNEIFDGLDNQKYDIIISACTITDERKEEYNFSIPYIQNYPCIVTLKESDNKPTNPSELAGMSICYQKGTTSESYITDYKATNKLDCETYGYIKVVSCFEELGLERVDAIFVDSTVAESYCNAEDSIYEITWQQQDNPEEFGIVIPKENTELTEKINSALNSIIEDGTLDEIINKYY